MVSEIIYFIAIAEAYRKTMGIEQPEESEEETDGNVEDAATIDLKKFMILKKVVGVKDFHP